MSWDDEYFCPNCGATLNDQSGFDPDDGAWTCTECGMPLYGDDLEDTMDQFDGVLWYCDSCGALLNKQDGFDDYCDTWYCTECGYGNPINEDEIRYPGQDDDYDDDDYSYDDDDDDDSYECSHKKYAGNSSARSHTTSSKAARKDKSDRIITRWIIIYFAFLAIWFGYDEIKKLIPLQYAADTLVGDKYTNVVEKLEKAGFSDVETNEIADLPASQISKEYVVTEVKIGWNTSFSETTKWPSNFPITVTYHTLKKAAVPMSSKEAKGSNYKDVHKAFKNAGFMNITNKIEYDILFDWFTKDGEVKSVVVDGDKKFDAGDEYKLNSNVVITYHTFIKNKP